MKKNIKNRAYILKKHLTTLILLMLISITHASATQFISKLMNSDNGLPSNNVNQVLQDDDGFMWMATREGIARYDGYAFVNFTQQAHAPSIDNNIGVLDMDHANRLLWIRTSTFNNLCYDLRHARYVDYTGRHDQYRPYQRMYHAKNNDVWLYDDLYGARRVRYANNQFNTIDYTPKNRKLATSKVNRINEDCTGRIWMATDRGIYSVDLAGKVTVMSKKAALYMNVSEDGRQIMFLCLNGQMLVYDSNSKIQTRQQIPAAMRNYKKVNADFCWRGQWMLFTDKGTFAYSLKKKIISQPIYCQVDNARSQGKVGGYHFVSNTTNRLWIFYPDGKVKDMQLIPEINIPFNKNRRYMIAKVGRQLYIATYGAGLFIYHIDNGKTEHFSSIDPEPIIESNYLMNIYVDRNASIWLPSEGGGVSCLTPQRNAISQYIEVAPGERGGWENYICGMALANPMQVRVATRQGNFYDVNLKTGSVSLQGNVKNSPNAWIRSRDGHLWIGTSNGMLLDGHLYQEDVSTSAFTPNYITNLVEDSFHRVWVASWGGLRLVKAANGKLQNIGIYLRSNINSCRIMTLALQNNGSLWVGTRNGIYLINTREKTIDEKKFIHFDVENGQLPFNQISDIVVSRDGTLWLGSRGAGVVKAEYNARTKKMTCEVINTERGLCNNSITEMVIDKQGIVIVGTENGISFINPKTLMVTNRKLSKYGPSNIYTNNSAVLMPDGRVLMGTCHGIAVINSSDRVKVQNDKQLQPHITDLIINGKSLTVENLNNENPLDSAVFVMNKIRLPYDKNSIDIYFSNFQYSQSPTSIYQYKLEGHDKDWQNMSDKNFASYGNLSPGTYIFHLRTPLGIRKWTSETTLCIVVQEPWWNTWWAWLIYVIILSLTAFYIYHNWRRHFDIEQEKKVNEFRVRFFTNVAHEFRTPLAIIHGAVNNMMADKAGHISNSDLQTADRGTKRLLRLVNQFLEFRKISTGNYQIRIQHGDIIFFVKDVYRNFWSMAKEYNISMDFTAFAKNFDVVFDQQVVETVVYNLLSNALKYTPEKGEVSLKIRKLEAVDKISIEVQNSGSGISPERQQKLFRPFMDGFASQGGMGIGLFTAREMALAHHGDLTYQDAPSGGCLFTFTLPSDESLYSEENYNMEPSASKEEDHREVTEEIIHELHPEAINNLTVAIIEDDHDMMEQIRQKVGVYFQTVGYTTGEKGIAGVLKDKPALLICDVMLPDTNGFEIIKNLKKEPSMRNTPTIMLTALGDDEQQIRGYKAGVDDYMVKPCNYNLLILRIIQLIRWYAERQQTEEKLEASPSETVSMKETSVNENDDDLQIIESTADKKFLDRLQAITLQHLGEEDFSMNQIPEILKMGRTKFFGKVKDLTGVTPGKYINNMRMDMAAELLKEGEMNIKEICFKLGIPDVSYFTRLFKDRYGMPPSKYKNEN